MIYEVDLGWEGNIMIPNGKRVEIAEVVSAVASRMSAADARNTLCHWECLMIMHLDQHSVGFRVPFHYCPPLADRDADIKESGGSCELIDTKKRSNLPAAKTSSSSRAWPAGNQTRRKT